MLQYIVGSDMICFKSTLRVKLVQRVHQVKQDQWGPRDLQESPVLRVCVESQALL